MKLTDALVLVLLVEAVLIAACYWLIAYGL